MRAKYARNPEKVLAPRRTPEFRAKVRQWDAARRQRKNERAAERRAAARARAEARRSGQ
jgi:hypothetical protein